MAKSSAKGGSARPASRNQTLREEIRSTAMACDIAAQQIKDDVVLREVELALEIFSVTVEKFGRIWLCGNGPGFCLATETSHRLITPLNRYERPTRCSVLGLNGATSTTSYGKCGIDDALASELLVNGRDDDTLWCFASDPGAQLTLGAAALAFGDLKMPVVVFTSYPGTPLVRYANSKIRIQSSAEQDQGGYCVQWAHSFLANVMCSQIKRLARRSRV